MVIYWQCLLHVKKKFIKKNNEIPTIIYVGSLTEERGLKKMIKAYKIVKTKAKANLTIVGGFYDPKLEKWAMNYDSKYNLNINWKGWINYLNLQF